MSNESGPADARTDAQKQFEKFADTVVNVDTTLDFVQGSG